LQISSESNRFGQFAYHHEVFVLVLRIATGCGQLAGNLHFQGKFLPFDGCSPNREHKFGFTYHLIGFRIGNYGFLAYFNN
jgi:hypothetical protein